MSFYELPEMKVTVFGPTAEHNHPCAICRKDHSVLDLTRGVMEPCWECQKQGWHLEKKKPRWVSKFWKGLQWKP